MKNFSPKQFDKWVDIWYKRFLKEEKRQYVNLKIYFIPRNTSGLMTIVENVKTGRKGCSKCNKKDKYNSKIGIAIAFARYAGCTDSIFIEGQPYLFMYNLKKNK
jgi:flavin-dependent dehydrogenase